LKNVLVQSGKTIKDVALASDKKVCVCFTYFMSRYHHPFIRHEKIYTWKPTVIVNVQKA